MIKHFDCNNFCIQLPQFKNWTNRRKKKKIVKKLFPGKSFSFFFKESFIPYPSTKYRKKNGYSTIIAEFLLIVLIVASKLCWNIYVLLI